MPMGLDKGLAYGKVFGTLRRYDYLLQERRGLPMPPPGRDESVDIIVPAVPKDAGVLPACLEGAIGNVANKIGGIYVVAPGSGSDGLREVAARFGATFVDEAGVLGYGPRSIGYSRNGRDKSGWIFQQLLKLSGNVGSCRHYVTIDADHVLLRPHTFVDCVGRSVFYMSEEYFYPYYRFHKMAFGRFPWHRLSYIAHKMVFERGAVADLQDRLRRAFGRPWDEGLVEALKSDPALSFSEFETYGFFYPAARKVMLPWRQLALRKAVGRQYTYAGLKEKYGADYLSVTLPDYMKVQ